jgi:hypothetical protein
VHAAVRHVGQVDGDEVVCVGPGLRAGGDLLAGVLVQIRADLQVGERGVHLGGTKICCRESWLCTFELAKL